MKKSLVYTIVIKLVELVLFIVKELAKEEKAKSGE